MMSSIGVIIISLVVTNVLFWLRVIWSFQNNIHTLEEKLRRKESELFSTVKKLEGLEVPWRESLANKETELVRIKEELRQARDFLDEKKIQNKELSTEISVVILDKNTLSDEKAALERELSTSYHRTLELTNDVERLKTKLCTVNSNAESLASNGEALKLKLEEKEAVIQNLNSRLDAQDIQIQNYGSEIMELNNKCSALSQKHQDSWEKVLSLTEDLIESRAQGYYYLDNIGKVGNYLLSAWRDGVVSKDPYIEQATVVIEVANLEKETPTVLGPMISEPELISPTLTKTETVEETISW